MSKSFTFRAIRSAAIMFAMVGAISMMSQSAEAQSCGYGGGGYGGFGSYSSGFRGYSNYGRGVSVSVQRSPYYRSSRSYYNVPRYDYNPGRNVRHSNRYYYAPRQSSCNRSGYRGW